MTEPQNKSNAKGHNGIKALPFSFNSRKRLSPTKYVVNKVSNVARLGGFSPLEHLGFEKLALGVLLCSHRNDFKIVAIVQKKRTKLLIKCVNIVLMLLANLF